MSDAALEPVPESTPVKKPDPAALAIASAREKLYKYLPRAVEIIVELAEMSENDRVRLAAAESIADRSGLGKSQTHQVQVSQTEHDVAEIEAQELLAQIERNHAQITGPTPTLDTLIVLEGEEVLTPAST